MATITNYFEQVQLSLAAYALDLQQGMSGSNQTTAYIDKLVFAGMSQKQAETFADTYTVVDQFTDPFTGFSGTVFADSSGKKYFAVRGTEAPSTASGIIDWLANIGDIGADGIAINQGLSLYNYLQRLYAPAGSVDQYYYNPLTRTISKTTITVEANGPLFEQTASMTVAGHSLGGHLAMMMSRMAPNLVSEVYTYNAPGFDTSLWPLTNPNPLTLNFPLTSDGFFNLLRGTVQSPLTGPIGTGWNAAMTHFNVPGDVVHSIGDTPGSVPQTIFSETADEDPIDAHSIQAITDSLAVYKLFATLAPSTQVSTITNILKATSNDNTNTLEFSLGAIRTLFQENYDKGNTIMQWRMAI